jgi:hypothetical protein
MEILAIYSLFENKSIAKMHPNLEMGLLHFWMNVLNLDEEMLFHLPQIWFIKIQ